jgi:hypothetical protein
MGVVGVSVPGEAGEGTSIGGAVGGLSGGASLGCAGGEGWLGCVGCGSGTDGGVLSCMVMA